MKVTEVNQLTDDQWIMFSKRYSEEIRTNNSKKTVSADWKELKAKFLSDCNVFKSESYNFFVVFDDVNKPVTWFDVNNTNKAMFDFEEYYSSVSIETFRHIFRTLIAFIDETGKDEIYTIEDCDKVIESLNKTGAEIYDEPTYSVVKKKDLNVEQLNEISSRNIGDDLKLVLYRDIPEELYGSFIELDNEASVDKEKFHPKMKDPSVMNKKDLRKAIESKNIAGHPFYMYVLLDKNKIAAFCSVYIRDNGKSVDHVGNLGLTTVGRNYRGRGLAKFLKANMYLKMLEEQPGFEYIITDTYQWNKYMYRINEEFGFAPNIKRVRYRLTKDFLKTFIEK